jgi:methyl-accepting chemotaxis protein
VKPVFKIFLTRNALLGALPVVVALLLSGFISFSYNHLLKNYRDAVDHTFQVMSGIDNVLLRLQDAETGQRGFIITGDEAYLAPFKSAELELSEVLAGLDRLVSDNADQQIEIANLQQLADGKLSELQERIVTRRRGAGTRKAQGYEQHREGNDGSYPLCCKRDADRGATVARSPSFERAMGPVRTGPMTLPFCGG